MGFGLCRERLCDSEVSLATRTLFRGLPCSLVAECTDSEELSRVS